MIKAPYNIVIPARYASERLPGKLLLGLAGRPLIEHAWRAARASSAEQVVVATDDDRIRAVVEGFGARCVMTAKDHASGSDRIAECAAQLGWGSDQLIVNLQGDEPSMPAACLDQVAALLAEGQGDVATLCWPAEQPQEVEDPNVVKVVFDQQGRALYFSRSVIPFVRDVPDAAAALTRGVAYYRHLGLYAYRHDALKRFTASGPTALEQAERLEQLRFQELGLTLRVAVALAPIPPGIDTAADLDRERAAREGQAAK